MLDEVEDDGELVGEIDGGNRCCDSRHVCGVCVLYMLPLTRVSSSAHVAPSGMGYYVIALGAAVARLN